MTYTYHTSQRQPKRFSRFGQRSRFQGRGSSGRQNRTQKTVDPSLLVKKGISQVPTEAYTPTHSFADFQIAPALKDNIVRRGYTEPTPIQDQAIPSILEGRDVVGIANTGTGKTAAFLIPLLHKISQRPAERVLIVAPTRELALQIYDEARAFAQGMRIYAALCIGGVSIRPQVEALRRNPQIVIGTPGRLKDLKNQNKLTFVPFSNIVLDEVDRMLDMGFIQDVRFIISHLPKYRQSLFFSATLTHEIKEVMQSFLKNPVTISVKTQETAQNVDQDVIKLNGRMKVDVLYELLTQKEFEKVLVFGRTKWGIDKLSKQLLQKGIRVVALHGNKNQNQRLRALEEFKQNRVAVLLATDIASRGLDIDDVTHVINFDLPESYEDYVHRIGRTGRANKLGKALSLIP